MKKQPEAKPELSHPFRDARRASVPLVQYETSDPAATISNCLAALNGSSKDTPVLQWDLGRLLQPVNQAGADVITELGKGEQDPKSISNPAEFLRYLVKPESLRALRKAILFIHNAHRMIDDVSIMQGVWNVRDAFKAQGTTLVLLGVTGKVPAELKHDCVTLTDELPGPGELASIVKRMSEAAQASGADIDPETVSQDGQVIDSLLGLSAFGAEQVTAMSIRKTGMDKASLWERKRRMVEQTPGLSVWRGGETFDQLGGLENLKRFLTLVLTSGKTPVRAIGFIDEIEKGLAGAGGDTSGTSQDQLQVFLKVMQDLNIPGIILVGPPGTGKSAIAKAAGTVAGAPVVAIDTGSMKGSLVGESEGRIRAAMDVFKAISQGKGLFIATCNKIASLPPELRRRFTLGTFYVDLPNASERKAIWQVWAKRYDITPEPIQDDGFTGAEIRACCDVAFRTGLPLTEAAKFIVPVCKSAAEQINALRSMANGKFISANVPGVYNMNAAAPVQESQGRQIKFD